MSFYYIKTNITKGFDVGSKARLDCEQIFKMFNIKDLSLEYSYEYKKRKYFRKYFKKLSLWKYKRKNILKLRKLNSEDIIICEFPILANYGSDLGKMFEKNILRNILKNKMKVIFLIHDIDGLRFNDEKRLLEELELLKKAEIIISHNKNMSNFLRERGLKNKILELNIFDYLLENRQNNNIIEKNTVCYVGNLDYNKSKFIYKLNKIPNIKFNIYGANYDESKNNNSFIYKGKFSPEEICNKLEGKFGLIWDGDEVEKCGGVYGKYLQYNNPHKLSMYIAAGIPIICWEKCAISQLVKEKNIGVIVKSLNELDKKLPSISEKEYEDMKENVIKLQQKIIKGDILKDILKKIINV